MRRPQARLIARVMRGLAIQVAVKDLDQYDWKSLRALRRGRKKVLDEVQALLPRLDQWAHAGRK